MSKLYLITGPAGVGKSTISKRLASELKKSVLIEGDDIYNQFVGGRISPYKENAPLNLFWQNIKFLITNYLENDYDVVFNYIINKKNFYELRELFKDYNIKFTVLLTDEQTLIKRDKERPKDCRMGNRSIELLNEFKNMNYDDKYILNTTNLTIEDSVKEILTKNKFQIKKMKLENIATPENILEYMIDNIKYGWLDINNEIHIGTMKNFRKLYKTSSIEEVLKYKVGTCIEQVYLMKYFLDKLNIKSKMFCTRIYEGENFNNLEAEEHMHCFLLYYQNNKVYHLEHPDMNNIGIHEYPNELEALTKINEYHINLSKGKSRPITEFYEVKTNLSFKEFNLYINKLDENTINQDNTQIEIKEYEEKYIEEIRDLLVELEEYIVSIDKDNLDIVGKDYREQMILYDLKEIKNNQGKMFIAIKNNKPIGLIAGSVCKYSKEDLLDYKCPKKGEIIELIVTNKERTSGVGDQLIKKMEEYFKSIGCEYIMISVFAYNSNAIKFYKKERYHPRMIDMIKKI